MKTTQGEIFAVRAECFKFRYMCFKISITILKTKLCKLDTFYGVPFSHITIYLSLTYLFLHTFSSLFMRQEKETEFKSMPSDGKELNLRLKHFQNCLPTILQ